MLPDLGLTPWTPSHREQMRTKYQYYTLKGTERSRGDGVHAFSAELSLVRGVALAPPHGRLVLCPPFGAPLECQQVCLCDPCDGISRA